MPKGVYPHTHIAPKTYPKPMVEKVIALYYDRGMSQAEVAATLGVSQKVVWKLMKNHGLKTRPRIKRNQTGANNSTWKGNRAGYQALHLRVAAARGKPMKCSRCGTVDPGKSYDWANLTGRLHDVSDYERMCRSCHRRFDATRRRAEVVAQCPRTSN